MCVPQAVANPNARLGSLRTHDLKLSCSAATSTSAQAPMLEMQSLPRHVRAQVPRLHGTAPATSLNTDFTAPAPNVVGHQEIKERAVAAWATVKSSKWSHPSAHSPSWLQRQFPGLTRHSS